MTALVHEVDAKFPMPEQNPCLAPTEDPFEGPLVEVSLVGKGGEAPAACCMHSQLGTASC